MWTTSENWKHCGRVLLGNWASPRGRRDHHTTPPPPILIVTDTIWRKKKEKTNTETTRIRKTTTRMNYHILAFQPMRSVCKMKPALDYFFVIPQILLDHRLSCLFFFHFSLIRRIAHFGSCVPFQVLCFFHWSAWYGIWHFMYTIKDYDRKPRLIGLDIWR